MARVSIDAGLLQMIRNGLERDASDGRAIRAEWVAEIDRDAQPAPVADSMDTVRLDWLADRDNAIGQVLLPTECVTAHLDDMRAAIDAAMAMTPRAEGG